MSLVQRIADLAARIAAEVKTKVDADWVGTWWGNLVQINGKPIGVVTPAAGIFTTLRAINQIRSDDSFVAVAGTPVCFGNSSDASVAEISSPSPATMKLRTAYMDTFTASALTGNTSHTAFSVDTVAASNFMMFRQGAQLGAIVGSEASIYGANPNNYGTYLYGGNEYFVSVGGPKVLRVLPTGVNVIGALTTTGLKEDAAGNLGIGTQPKAWALGRAIDLGFAGAVYGDGINASWSTGLAQNAYAASYPGTWAYKVSGIGASRVECNEGFVRIFSAPPGTAGDPISFAMPMTLDSSGNLLVGAAFGSGHVFQKNTPVESGDWIFQVTTSTNISALIYPVSGAFSNTANAAMKLGSDAQTGRSINAGGTINASGADYAEYEFNNGLAIKKGAIVGFRRDGSLTLTFADAIRYGIKSTDPSYVGGDVWGSEDRVGKRPEPPVYQRPDYVGRQKPAAPPAPPVLSLPDGPVQQEGVPVEIHIAMVEQYEAAVARAESAHIAALHAHEAALAEWQAAYEQWERDHDSHQAELIAADAAHRYRVEQYQADKVVFEQKLEDARRCVDRIAYAGKVPCSVTGATPGGYIIASEGGGGEIIGEFVADPDFSQYKRAVGRVNRILGDGRCEVAVIVH